MLLIIDSNFSLFQLLDCFYVYYSILSMVLPQHKTFFTLPRETIQRNFFSAKGTCDVLGCNFRKSPWFHHFVEKLVSTKNQTLLFMICRKWPSCSVPMNASTQTPKWYRIGPMPAQNWSCQCMWKWMILATAPCQTWRTTWLTENINESIKRLNKQTERQLNNQTNRRTDR